MSGYYAGGSARSYDTRLRAFTERTLAEALAMIDVVALRGVPEREGRPPRALDVACGTGLLLKRLLGLAPEIEAHGIDASADMLAQARVNLDAFAHRVRLRQVEVGAGGAVTLPYAPETFDLITCTNALHDMPDPVGALAGLGRLLAPGGQLAYVSRGMWGLVIPPRGAAMAAHRARSSQLAASAKGAASRPSMTSCRVSLAKDSALR
jgi:SAM-dependent methyltransferase